jgi:23S rRNA pseudouridine2605 synthase
MNDETQAEGSEVREGQRIAKVMARAGVCSRRDAEAWIAEGRVSVNGEVLTSPAFNVSETDDVRVDGQRLAAPERTRLFLFHKPRGLVTTARDPEGRNTVFAVLPPDLPRVVAIGRLDINTEGLLLLTNDGGLSRVLELPSTGWLRRYRVRAHGNIDQAALDRLAGGVTIEGVNYLGIEAKLDREQGANAWLTLGLREGKNREIKKILEHLGLAVNRLIRVSFGPFELGDLPEGEVMEVRTRVLRDQLGVKLAKEANVNFDAPQTVAVEPPPERKQGERGARENRGPKRPMQGRPDRGARGSEDRFEREATPRRTPPAPSTPERRRKHVSALRAEIAADSTTTRKRIERSATQDRKGRTIAIERVSRAGEEAGARAEPETRSKREGSPNNGERGGRPLKSSARAGRSDSFGPKRGRAAGGRERPPHSDSREPGRRPEQSDAARGDGGPRERRFDRPAANRDGDRRAGPPRTRDAGGPPRERKFDRPQGRSRPPAGEGGPPRFEDKSRGPRSDFKSSRTGARDGDRPPRADARNGGPRERRFDRPEAKRDGDRRDGPPRTRDAGGPPRERKFDRPAGRTRSPAAEGRPPRGDGENRGSRSDFKSRPYRAGARDGDRPQGPGRGARSEGGPPRERKFDRPQGRTRPPAAEGRPPRADGENRGPRSDFKARPPRAGARDGDRPQGPGRGARSEGGPPRGRSSAGQRPRPPGKGAPKGAGGPRRPPRKP